jgi:hypothetical protein
MNRSLRRRALRRGLVPLGADVRLSDLSPDRFPRADGYVRANRSTRPCVFLQARACGPSRHCWLARRVGQQERGGIG